MKFPQLRILRKQAGINRQAILAEELGWSTETIVDIEAERIGIDENTVTEIRSAIQRFTEKQREEVTAA